MQLLTKKDYIQYFIKNGQNVLSKSPKSLSKNDKAKVINNEIGALAAQLTSQERVNISVKNTDKSAILSNILTINYSSYIAMLELRNSIWEYEYMAFSRRIGELWEKFIKLVFDNSPKGISQFSPPQYHDVEAAFRKNYCAIVQDLTIDDCFKKQLIDQYNILLHLLCSGEINLALDIHFTSNEMRYNVDLKSGFGSNEKGNVNRLLMVANIYKGIDSGYNNVLLVRAPEASNNNYFQVLKKSPVWEAYCSNEAYKKIEYFTGYDLASWIKNNISWANDFSTTTYSDFTKNNLLTYLDW